MKPNLDQPSRSSLNWFSWLGSRWIQTLKVKDLRQTKADTKHHITETVIDIYMDGSTYVVVMLLLIAYYQVMSSELIEIIQFLFILFFSLTHSLTQSFILSSIWVIIIIIIVICDIIIIDIYFLWQHLNLFFYPIFCYGCLRKCYLTYKSHHYSYITFVTNELYNKQHYKLLQLNI